MELGSRKLKKLDWRKQLQQSENSVGQPSRRSRMADSSNVGKAKKVAQPDEGKKAMPTKFTIETVTFEGLSGSVCRTWWVEAQTLDDTALKTSLCRARVHWAIPMPVFAIRNFEPYLRMLIKTYNAEL